ncbi:Gfo/Idh/MocA family oxidoreductase [bacterium]|nr:Gfo/Idh/MocA family oxidoreductase [bacterium]RQV97818.1 MAG: gfo/Idh/MocA family oxidoreductase [bacterium]
MERREFLGATAAAFAATVVPRHVLGGAGFIAPSDKITMGYIGCGTQGIREMISLLPEEDIQIVAVCDPNKRSTNYVDWSKNGIRNSIRNFLENPSWGEGLDGIPGGRDIGKEIVETYYAKNRASESYHGCASYADFRELLEKETDLDAVKIMIPDHLHATISIAAMKKGCHVVMHKPLANRVYEARLIDEVTRQTGVATHLSAWRGTSDAIRDMILDGAIGSLREIHDWTNRPVWPQYTDIPTDTPPIPKDFDWDLWLGPVPHRPYHPHYTHAVFRGWYDFGGGSMADMGNYSLWPVFDAFGFGTPIRIDANPSTDCQIVDQVSTSKIIDFAFPKACTIRFKFAAQGKYPAFDLHWYDGGMKPPTPPELEMDNKVIPREGTMFVGDQGKILNGQLIPEKRMREYLGIGEDETMDVRRGSGSGGNRIWIEAFKGGPPSPGNFLNAKAVTETIALGSVGLRVRSREEGSNTPPLDWDTQNMQFTNLPEANEFLHREYREGWELKGI